MAMEFLGLYKDTIWQTPNDKYNGLLQATIDTKWEDSTQVRTIKEQAFPFSDKYTEYEAWVDTVSGISVNTNKNISDFITVLFRDVNHPLNHKGQKYLYKYDGESENIYLCYDRMNQLTGKPDFKCVRCNNHLTWIGSDGNIIKEPCYIGYELTSTNNQVSSDSTLPQRRLVCMIQGNDNTSTINLNQRFILSHKQAFKITEMNVYSEEDYNTEYVPMYTYYIEWSTILATDNTELNLADYYTSNYKVQIDQDNLSLEPSSTGVLTATVTLNGTPTTVPLTWESSDTSVATIDSNGNYTVVGSDGESCTISCTIQGNVSISDSITISVANTTTDDKVLTLIPNTISSIYLGESADISYGVYINGVLQSDVVTIAYSGADISSYEVVEGSNSINILCVANSVTPLTITFTSGNLEESLTISLYGLL